MPNIPPCSHCMILALPPWHSGSVLGFFGFFFFSKMAPLVCQFLGNSCTLQINEILVLSPSKICSSFEELNLLPCTAQSYSKGKCKFSKWVTDCGSKQGFLILGSATEPFLVLGPSSEFCSELAAFCVTWCESVQESQT